jgi:hypothetical protein
MTYKEMQDHAKHIKEELGMDAVSTALTAIVEELEEHPDVTANLAKLLETYADLFTPMIHKLNETSIKVREEAFFRFKHAGLSDELAVKLVCGR